MAGDLNDIVNQQRESWDKFSTGWKKWDPVTMQFLKPFGDEIIQRLALKNDYTVLDVASGTGEPGLSIAGIVDKGKVIAIDLSEKMLATAQENAANRNITNYKTKTGDVTKLPFPDQTFDAMSCRMGFMFFPDIAATLNEMRRVLKPGARLAISVWSSPDKNFWVTVTMGTISQLMDLSPPPAAAPGMFRCAKPEFMVNQFEKAGFKNISASELGTTLSLDAETYWEMTTEVGAPIVAAMSNADAAMKEKIKNDVFRKIHEKFPDGNINMQATAILISGDA
ncbi:methyltransferase domain-containing protein [Haliea sp. AH-315-K21]|uniref:Methyltransferase type 11 n=1 Tax=SAR86 cluster bacterium TaxID=2030880 RepID=A0A2A5C9X0_9GAMM|nr:methyltransferase domain-containing protein [Haliea sp. AH-315-K21]PCJ40240.1 MAG: methyltransferase type 11 [SAR86 cluster bacterium]